MRTLTAIHKYLHRLEDIMLVSLLMIILSIAVLQIILRNFFDSGIIWGDSFLSVSVLWLGMAGAVFASRNNSHISIDLGVRILSTKSKQIANAVVFLFTAFICAIVAWYGVNLVLIEYADRTMAFAQIPTWLTISIIPLGFAIMALRYFIAFVLIINKQKPESGLPAGKHS